MSESMNPVQVLWVIRQDPYDETSLFFMLIDKQNTGVFLFTQPEFAKDFARSYPDMPTGAVIATVEVPALAQILQEQASLGRTHVITDPILGADKYLDQHTLSISDYLARLKPSRGR